MLCISYPTAILGLSIIPSDILANVPRSTFRMPSGYKANRIADIRPLSMISITTDMTISSPVSAFVQDIPPASSAPSHRHKTRQQPHG